MRYITAFYPVRLDDFRCIGSKCEDSCCVGWGVSIDKKTFQRYKGYVDDIELKSLFHKNVKRNSKSVSEKDYAKIVFNKGSAACPFLDEIGLCTIHGKLGSEALSALCQQYPRMFNKIDNDVEYTATLSCPEICRLLLLNVDGIVFKKGQVPVSDKHYFGTVYNTSSLKVKFERLLKYFVNIKLIVLSLVSYREYDIEIRLSIISIFIDKLIKYNYNSSDADIEKLLESFSNVEFLNTYRDVLIKKKERDKKLYYQLKFLKAWSDESYKDTRNSRFIANLNESMKWIAIPRLDTEVLDDYENIGLKRFKDFMKDKSYILENYLSIAVFSNFVPVTDLFDKITAAITAYVLLRNMFIGLLIADVELTDEKCVEVIQCFAKFVHHNYIYLNKIMSSLKEEGRYSLAHLLILLNIG